MDNISSPDIISVPTPNTKQIAKNPQQKKLSQSTIESTPTSTSSKRFQVFVSESVHIHLHDFHLQNKYKVKTAGALVEALLIAAGDIIEPMQVCDLNNTNSIKY